MTALAGKVEGAAKIAVLRANALGDYIFALPGLAALQSTYPNAEIVLLGKGWHKEYLTGRPGPVSRVVVVPPYRGVSESDQRPEHTPEEQAGHERFFAQMRAEQFDIAIQMHGGGGNSNPFVQRLGARLTAGLRAPGAPALDRWTPYVYWQHEVLRLIEVAGLVGAPPVMIEPQIAVTERDLREACTAFPDPGRPLVVLHPGASDPRRRWAAERFAAVGDRLAEAGCAVAVVGIRDESEVAAEVVGSMRHSAADLCGRLSLHGLTGLLARAALVIGNDSGPRHLAEAVGSATVGIYWCGNMINAGSAFRAMHRPHLSWQIECPVCGRNTLKEPCEHDASFVNDVPVEDVVESALDVLKTRLQNENTG